MRVIAGSAKKTSLKMPGSGRVRPTADRVKEALFNILGPMVMDAELVDLYAGSGALGIEALSRGGFYCYFIERDRAVSGTLRENLHRTKLQDQAEVIVADALKGLKMLARRGAVFDIIFADPPYSRGREAILLENISSLQVLKRGGVVVVESQKDRLLPDSVALLLQVRAETYGDTRLSFFTTSHD